MGEGVSLWVKRDRELKRNWKTYHLAELLGRGGGDLFGGRDPIAWRAIACQVLEEFWSHAFEHFPEGDVTDAPAEALRDAVRPFLDGTEWAQKDVRELLLRSGHLDETAEGRIVIHDWFEWNGGEAVRMASDRSRKRLKRADTARKKAGTRPHKRKGRGAGRNALAEMSRAELSRAEPVQQQQPGTSPAAASATTLPYATRCCIAVNTVLSERLAGAFRALTVAEHGDVATAWDASGIPIELVERTLAEKAWDFKATPLNRQPHTLRYFDAAVREAWSRQQAGANGGIPLSDADRARVTLERMEAEAAAAKGHA